MSNSPIDAPDSSGSDTDETDKKMLELFEILRNHGVAPTNVQLVASLCVWAGLPHSRA
ncbi:Uncharacterised protein [Mycobacteroides abscessus subsp. massiliense]|nr:Uncharacterised protein [Mycobacteroides abscessus subsp. massiliense]